MKTIWLTWRIWTSVSDPTASATPCRKKPATPSTKPAIHHRLETTRHTVVAREPPAPTVASLGFCYSARPSV
jgi:hypothetical protein